MRVPEKSELPLKAQPQILEVTEESVARFHQAFRSLGHDIPLTYGARALKGVFELIDQLQVDWRNLLHATQTFIPHAPIVVGQSLISQAQLLDCRLRAGIYWLQFEITLRDQKRNALVSTSKSLIMVRAETSPAPVALVTAAASAKALKTFEFEAITREQIKSYCEASGDFNRIHHDDDFAKQAGLPGIIAHGMLSMGLMARAFREWGVDITALKKFEAKFKDIVLPGDQLKAEFISETETEKNARVLSQKGIEVISGSLSF